MFRFENTIFLYLLTTVPILIIWFFIVLRLRKKTLQKFGEIKLVNILMPEFSNFRYKWKFVLSTIALIFLILGIANPQIGSKLKEVKRKGIEVIIALDVSNSMMAEDIEPNRLSRAKRAISKLIDNLGGNNIGLIVFAGEAYTQLPVTSDYASAKMFLSSINTDIVPVQGTAIGKAIELAINSFKKDDEKNKALIIITDGENHEDDAIKMAEEAKNKGIFVSTIGLGSQKGTPIPIIDNFNRKDYRRDQNGEVVMTKLNENLLSEIAVAGGGDFVIASNSNFGLDQIIETINSMEKQEFENKIYADYEDRFQYFIALSLFFLLLEIILLERKNKFFKNVNLFKINKI
jgi:Ca-activated chloride channel family protein